MTRWSSLIRGKQARKPFDPSSRNPGRRRFTATAAAADLSSQALDFFHGIQIPNPSDRFAWIRLLRSCSDEASGRRIHALIVSRGLEQDPLLGSPIVQMYLRCGSSIEADKVFHRLAHRGVVLWTLMMGSYAKDGRSVLLLFRQMQLDGVTPDRAALLTVLNTLRGPEFLRDVRTVRHLCRSILDLVLANALICVYGRCRSIADAWEIFQSIEDRDVVSWNSMLGAFAEVGHFDEARVLFRLMLLDGVRAERVTCVTMLHVCSAISALEDGKRVHLCCDEAGFVDDGIIVANALLNMYAKCRSPAEARRVFDGLKVRDLVSWTTMLSAYSLQGDHEQTRVVFERMNLDGVRIDRVATVTLLESCCSRSALETARAFHARARESGLDSILMVSNAIINMYGKCGSLQDARDVFDRMHRRDVISWNTIIGSYAQSGFWNQSVELFFLMEDVKPDNITFMTVVNSIASSQDIDAGKKIHSKIVEQGLETDPILGTGLVNMYGKCGYLDQARNLFDRIPEKRLVLWNCLLSAYVQFDQHQQAVEFFNKMDMDPDKITFITVLNACAGLQSLREGKIVRQRIVEAGLEKDVFVGTALLDMYAKCGTLQQAIDVFESLPERNHITWNSMVTAFAQHGRSIEAVTMFREMLQQDIAADKVTFVTALSACSHAGLTEEAAQYFTSLREDFGMEPSVEHYGCMVDLLGRLGWLEEAEKFISKMPVPANDVILATFLAACRIHGDVARAKRVAEEVTKMSSSGYVASSFVALSSIYAEGGEDHLEGERKTRSRRPQEARIELGDDEEFD